MSRLRTLFPVFFRVAAYWALLAMVVPTATALLHHPAPAAQDRVMSGMMMPGQPCPMDQDHTTGKNHKAPICPICQSLHILASGYVPPPLIALPGAAPAATAAVAALPLLRVAFAAAPQARPRAPPVRV